MDMKRILVILCALTWIAASFAEEVRFAVSGPRQVIEGKQFQLEYTLYNASGKNFKRPEFPGCKVLYEGRSTGTSVSVVNGKMDRQTTETHVITLRAEKEGSYTFEPATITADDKTYSTQSWKLTILPPDKSQASSGGNASGQQSGVGKTGDTRTFVRMVLSRTKTYEQEPVLATFKVYTRAQSLHPESFTFPTFEGFVSQEIELPQNQSFELENYNGENYKVATLKQCLLFPQRSGDIAIKEGKFDFLVETYEVVAGPFSYMQVPRSVSRSIASNAATIQVLPLPSGKPVSYMGGVGNFTLTSSINTTHVKANEAITLTLKVKGTGNLKYLKDPELDLPNDFELYDPKVDVNIRTTAAGVSGSRTVEYTMIPRFAGTFKIPAVEFSYFDTKAKSYKTLTTEAYEITVDKAADGSGGGAIANFSNKEDLRLLNQDIHYIKVSPMKLSKTTLNYINGWLYWLWYIIPALLFILFVFINRQQAKANADVALMKTRKANKVALKRLKIAGKYLKSHDRAHFYDEVLKAVWGYLSDKLSLPLSELTKDNVSAELEKYGAGAELIERFNDILERCEFARYAPSQSNEAMDELYAKTLDVIGKMENIKDVNRNRSMNKSYIGLLLAVMSFTAYGQESLTQANEAYAKEDYATAVQLYEQTAQEEGVSPDLYYNLGNAYYKQREYAEAILNYERALLLNPSHEDARFNLEMANAQVVDKIDTIDRFFLSVWLDTFRDLLSSNAWAIIGIVAFLLFIAGAYLYIFSHSVRVKKIGFFGGIVVLLLSIAANSFAWELNSKAQARDEAIVFAATVSAKSTPAESGTDLFVLHEGTKVSVLDTVGSWVEVKLSDGNRGWLPASAIEII